MAADRVSDGRRRDDDADAALVDRIRAGDEAAFALLHARYARRLERYAARVLGGHRRHAEDVVQEALLRAHRALGRDHRPIHLGPWLHTLVRNCCLDELSRVRLAPALLGDSTEPASLALAPAPDAVVEEREAVHAMLADIATLPAEQRHALLRRELDGLGHVELAAELGVTPRASKALVHRARLNVIKGREARDASCTVVQGDLLAAHDARRRAAATTYRHLLGCRDCRAFRDELRSVRRTAHLLAPPLGVAALLGALGAKATGGTAAKTGGVAALAASAAIAAPLVIGPGEPSPLAVRSPALPGGALAQGDPLPRGTAMVTRRITLRRGAPPPRAIALTCPPGMRVAGMLPPRGTRLGVGYAPGVSAGADTTARLVFASSGPVAADGAVIVGTLCRRVDARGSVLAGDVQGRAASTAARRPWTKSCAAHAYLRAAPRAAASVTGSARAMQPVQVVRASGGWARVATDTGERGWIRAGALCRRAVVGAP